MKQITLRNIYVLTNAKYVGDKNQSNGVVDALERKLKPLEVKRIECDEGTLSENLKEFTANDVVISAGEHGLQAVKKIKNTLPHSSQPITILTGHEFFPEFKKLEKGHYPNIVALPNGALEKHEIELLNENSIYLPLIGVPHQVTEENVNKDLRGFNNPPELSGKFPVGIILGGDAPDHNKETMELFTPADARIRASFIVKDLKSLGYLKDNTVFIITNGPRTGQHDYHTKAELKPNPHKEHKVDEVSTAFLEQLKELKIPEQQIQFYNFDYIFPSAYKPLLHWIASNKSVIYVPAESVSMVTESEYVSRRKGHVIVYSVCSENLSHTRINQVFFKSGVVDLLDGEGKHHQASTQPKFSEKSDADIVAEEISKKIIIRKLSASSFTVSSSSTSTPTDISSSSSSMRPS